eukprot:1162839-Amorphochlora_amoeboformis.AAC.1
MSAGALLALAGCNLERGFLKEFNMRPLDAGLWKWLKTVNFTMRIPTPNADPPSNQSAPAKSPQDYNARESKRGKKLIT